MCDVSVLGGAVRKDPPSSAPSRAALVPTSHFTRVARLSTDRLYVYEHVARTRIEHVTSTSGEKPRINM